MVETRLVCDTCGQLAFWGYYRTDHSLEELVSEHKNANKGHKAKFTRIDE
jgi:hypothetical protein